MTTKKIDTTAEELALVIGLLVRKMRNAPPSKSEFSWTQKAIIIRLDKDGPMTISDLARAEGIKSQSMGAAIASLDQMKVVERKAHPTDGRQTIIQLTEFGISMRKNGRHARQTWLAQAIKKLEKDERDILVSAVKVLKKAAAQV